MDASSDAGGGFLNAVGCGNNSVQEFCRTTSCSGPKQIHYCLQFVVEKLHGRPPWQQHRHILTAGVTC